jgi:Probable Zinc-ribbon domain
MQYLTETHPDLILEWDIAANKPLSPSQVSYGCKKKVWWRCLKNPDHFWKTTINSRTKPKASSCPYCCGQKVDASNCLANSHPELCKQWHPSLNKITPNEVTAHTNKKAWWQCDKSPDHVWQASIQNRSKENGTSCPCCCNRKTVLSNCLSATHPELCKQWHLSLNTITPEEVTSGSINRVWWQCDKHIDHVWNVPVITRVRKHTGCPYCIGKLASSTNNLTLRPEIAKEWDETRNGCAANQVPLGSSRLAWWICSKNTLHTWQATINNRTSKNHPCPYCAGKKADATTSLLAKHPNICKEWDVGNILSPKDVLPNSHKKVWWQCTKDLSHRWLATPNSRVSSLSGCPYCNESKGENIIDKFLKDLGIIYSRQYKTTKCVHKNRLSFDFAIHDPKLGLIEFNGLQHYQPIKYFGGQNQFNIQRRRDEIKQNYCKENNIPLLIIHCKDIRKIPKLITEFLSQLFVVPERLDMLLANVL